MTDKPTLPPPPQTLSRGDVLAKIAKKDALVEVPGVGLLRYKSLTMKEAIEVSDLATNGSGKPDVHEATLWGIIRSFPDTFEDADIADLRDADASYVAAFAGVMNQAAGRGSEAANGPLTFREVPGAGKPVHRRKRSG